MTGAKTWVVNIAKFNRRDFKQVILIFKGSPVFL